MTESDAYSFERNSSITGAVALMYSSDYAYGVLSSACKRSITPFNYSGKSVCYTSNWLYQGSTQFQWLITPNSSFPSYAFYISTVGSVIYSNSNVGVVGLYAYSPVMALSNDVVVTGTGTESDPYVMN